MTSIITNAAALSALDTLRSIGGNLQKTQQQVSSGLRVGTASDNAAYWSISTMMKSETKAFGAVEDSIGLAQAVMDTTYAGMANVLQHLNEMKALLVQAADHLTNETTPMGLISAPLTGNLQKIDMQFDQHMVSIFNIAKSASFSGINLLIAEQNQHPAEAEIGFVTGYAGGKIQTTNIGLKNTALFSKALASTDPTSRGMLEDQLNFKLFDSSGNWTGTGDYTLFPLNSRLMGYGGEDLYLYSEKSYIFQRINSHVAGFAPPETRAASYRSFAEEFESLITSVTDGMATVGAVQKSLARSSELMKDRIDTATIGIGHLIDADMNEASTRLKALQTQEQLGIQALQIANASSDNIMQLFR